MSVLAGLNVVSNLTKSFVRYFTTDWKDWKFSSIRKTMYASQYDEWELYYLPIAVSGLVILDIGAGEGETAKFFFDHGARGVICVECEKNSVKLLRENAKNHNMLVIDEPFNLSHLDIEFDFMKMDIEGWEEKMLARSMIKQPCAIEVHSIPLRKRFEKAGYQIAFSSEADRLGMGSICYAYGGI